MITPGIIESAGDWERIILRLSGLITTLLPIPERNHPMTIESTPLQPTPTQVSAKSFGIRAGAFIIDSVVAGVITFIISIILGIAIGLLIASSGQELQRDQFSSSQILEWFVGAIVSLLYFIIFEGLYGATPGKLLLGIRVVKENGASCDFSAAFIRGVIRMVDGLVFGVPAYFTMKPPLFQRIGDKAAKTIVVGSKDPIIQDHIDWWWFVIAGGFYTAIDLVVTLLLLIAAMP